MKKMNRFLEVDLVRGFFILSVAVFHFLWDLNFFFNAKIQLYSPLGSFLQRLGSTVFFLLVGISTIIQKNNKGTSYSFKVALLRGSRILAFAIALSIVVTLTYPQNNIIFGILHCIGVSTIIIFPFLKMKKLSLAMGLGIIAVSQLLKSITVSSTKLLVPFGIKYNGFYSVDYFPLFPWFGVVLMGVFFGKVLYPKEKPLNFLESLNGNLHKSKNWLLQLLITAGQKSLLIYLLHQPLLYGVCFLVCKIPAIRGSF